MFTRKIFTAILLSLALASSRAQPVAPAPQASGAAQGCKDWTAVHHPSRLTVTGTCDVLLQAKLTLTAAIIPVGFDPQVLLLNLKIKDPTGPHSEAIVPKPVTFVRHTTKQYKTVSIDGTEIPVTLKK